jgi:dihydrofolate reductase
VAENGTIGVNNRLAWHIPEEWEFFKSMTSGSTVVFGRKTFESIGKVLPNRRNIILSHSNMTISSGIVVHSVQELLEVTDSAWVCGGRCIYELLLPYCRELYLSKIKGDYDGDTQFPEYKSMFEEDSTLYEGKQFCVTKFVNKNYIANA